LFSSSLIDWSRFCYIILSLATDYYESYWVISSLWISFYEFSKFPGSTFVGGWIDGTETGSSKGKFGLGFSRLVKYFVI